VLTVTEGAPVEVVGTAALDDEAILATVTGAVEAAIDTAIEAAIEAAAG
jgi:hypothetical protein